MPGRRSKSDAQDVPIAGGADRGSKAKRRKSRTDGPQDPRQRQAPSPDRFVGGASSDEESLPSASSQGQWLVIVFHQPFAQIDLVGLNIHPSSTPTILYVFLMREYEACTCDVKVVVDARYNLVVHIQDLGQAVLGHGGSGAQEDGGLCLKIGFAGTSSLHENGVKFVGLDIFLAKLGTASVRPNFPIRVERKLVQLACSTMRTWPVAPFRDNFISTKKTNETRIFHGGELLDGTSPPLTTRPTAY
eukprot:s1513_g12.t2